MNPNYIPSTASLADLRKDYTTDELLEAAAGTDPFALFERWLAEAIARATHEPHAMNLATVGPDGRPSSRMVLLKGFDRAGLVFYTNYLSRKGRELDHVPFAALNLFWPDLERQVRVEGRVERLQQAESEAYFKSRPFGSQAAAWASPQSQPVADRAALEARWEAFLAQHPDPSSAPDAPALPLPDFWGGYRVVPDYFEFWQGRASRLHDRLAYRLDGPSGWLRQRLAP